MKKRIYIILGVVVLLCIVGYFIWNQGGGEQEEIFVKVKKGGFKITVENSGELYAKKSVDIRGPEGLRNAQIWQVKIANIIPEGQQVKEGDFVASLDRSELIDKLRSKQADLDKANSQYTQTKLDTTLELREARDNMVNLRFSQQEKKIELQQSQYEPPATIKKAEIDLEKSERAYSQATENYLIKQRKAVARMQEAAATLSQSQQSVDFLQSLLDEFEITAPEAGMVIYSRDWGGEKRREGSSISSWDPIVATLPDMSVMVSRTYVNEVDIRKIKTGQKVTIGLDAFPEKKLTGKVIEVANVGEQRPKSDAKVFEVNIEINQKDTLLMPSMTTSNLILTEAIPTAFYVPLESLNTLGDSLTYVFKKTTTGLVRQQVKAGKANSNEIQILAGLTEEDEVLISRPSKPDSYRLVKLSPAELKEDKEKPKTKSKEITQR